MNGLSRITPSPGRFLNDKPDSVRRIVHLAISHITVEFVVVQAPGFIDGGGVCLHVKSTMDICEVVIRDDRRGWYLMTSFKPAASQRSELRLIVATAAPTAFATTSPGGRSDRRLSDLGPRCRAAGGNACSSKAR
jgi:hypothetical protein